MLVRSHSLKTGMSQYLVDQILAIPNIQVRHQMEVVEVNGDGHLENICVADLESGKVETLPASAMFIFIGAVPHTDMIASLVERDLAGFILTGPDLLKNGQRPQGWGLRRDPYLLETSCPGIFAAGDVRHSSIKRVATAVGEGAMTVAFVHQYLRTV